MQSSLYAFPSVLYLKETTSTILRSEWLFEGKQTVKGPRRQMLAWKYKWNFLIFRFSNSDSPFYVYSWVLRPNWIFPFCHILSHLGYNEMWPSSRNVWLKTSLRLVWFLLKGENGGIGGSNTDPINLMHWTIWKIRKT